MNIKQATDSDTDCNDSQTCVSTSKLEFKPSNISKIKELTDKLDGFELVELFFNLCPEMFCVINPKYEFVKTNNRWLSLGWSTQDLTNKSVLDFIHPDDVYKMKLAFDSCGDEPMIAITRCKTKMGNCKLLEWNILLRQDGRYYAAVREATDRCVRCINAK